jgi:cupin superfamily acireductone dioxygenase involved in methionine salvage
MVQAFCIHPDGKRDDSRPAPSLDTIKALTGVQVWQVDADKYKTDDTLAIFRKRPDYSYEDIFQITPEVLETKKIGEEHLHADGEVRLCLSGGGNVDVRDTEDKWIRLVVSKGDLWSVAPGVFHRFSLGDNEQGTFLRICMGSPCWKAAFRASVTDSCVERQMYRKIAANGFQF